MEDTRLCKAVVIHFDAKQDFGHHLLDIYQGINIELEYFLLGLMLYLGEVSDSVESPDLYMKDVFMIFRRIMEISIKKYNEKCISIVIEENYVDRIYRSSYYSRYSYKHFNVGRQCLRLFIFIGDINTLHYYDDYSLEMCKTLEQRFVGFLVLTPNQGCTISRSVFTPNFFVDELLVNTMIRIADYRCTMYGHRLSLQGFPYLKQDSDSISCAEVTLLLITDYYSQMYQEFSVAMPNDVLALINRHDPQRISPSHGVKYDTLSRVLKDQGFYPLLISTEEIHDNVQSRAKYILHSYLDSCIPVAIHISNNENQDSINHSVLCIGYGGKNLENITSNIRIKSMVGIKSENKNNSINYIYI